MLALEAFTCLTSMGPIDPAVAPHIGRTASGAPPTSVGGSAHVAASPGSSLVSAQTPPGDRSLGLTG